MECPVCLTNKPKKSLLSLECGHGLCLRCSGKWLIKNPTCPICRQNTLVCSRSTRSREKSENLIRFIYYYERLIRDHNIEEVFPDIADVVSFLDIIFVREKHIWYRPDMYSMLQPLKQTVKAMLLSSENSTIQHFKLSPYEKQVLRNIIEIWSTLM